MVENNNGKVESDSSSNTNSGQHNDADKKQFDHVKLSWFREHVLSKFNYENTLLFASIVIFIIFGIVSIIFFINPHKEGFWTNYWTGTPIVITIIAALSSFYIQSRINQKNSAHEDYFQYQDEIDKEIMPKFSSFQLVKDKNISQENKEKLVENLSEILLAITISDNKRGDLVPTTEDDTYQKGRAVIDYNDYFARELQTILSKDEYKEVIQTVKDSHHYFEDALDNIVNEADINKLKEFSEEDRTRLQNYINVYDDLILKAWVLKKANAEKAKYLIGVSTSNKTIVGAYNLSEHRINVDQSNNRIEFDVRKHENRLYLAGITDNYTNGEKIKLPGLEKWTASNPVLYYIRYLKVTNQYENFGNDNIKTVLNTLHIHFNENQEKVEWEKLGDRDIIVVRTYRLGEFKAASKETKKLNKN
ncbi:hypothetical protein [Fructobacillus tropaeoli]|uniref:Uncharacterized protein n=1 Tax=Fructobacillus tropaeoli TaxID=709323 RepID=A0ABN9YVB6_9LACO|nr:hypothetical protein [Fructobacillus tropaeoli]GIC70500.1 hypothetical protein FT12353_11710 [Fructobacillus tropaeoli]CAK1248446.1 unnamed protein product [Fructobacillus tropaeoli]